MNRLNQLLQRKTSVWVPVISLVMVFAFIQMTADRNSPLHLEVQKENVREYRVARSADRTIPKIIHQIWNDDIVPTEFVENVRSFIKRNAYPEWDYYFWTLDLGREFIRLKFPELLNIYDKSDMYTKPDILRTVIIYHYGGTYFDLDIVNIRPLDRFVDTHECALSGAIPEYFVAYDYAVDYRRVNNAILLCRPNHPFFRQLVSRTADRSDRCLSNQTCPRPEMPYSLLKDLTDHGKNESIPEILDSSYFEPIYDLTISRKLRRKCSKVVYKTLESVKQAICDNWRRLGEDRRTVSEHSYTIHTWFHTSIKSVTRDHRNRISKIVPHVKMYNSMLEALYGPA